MQLIGATKLQRWKAINRDHTDLGVINLGLEVYLDHPWQRLE